VFFIFFGIGIIIIGIMLIIKASSNSVEKKQYFIDNQSVEILVEDNAHRMQESYGNIQINNINNFCDVVETEGIIGEHPSIEGQFLNIDEIY
jgi:hypothetical protein